jgi:uncharacterized repeat protein (TIGR01451 family)
MHRARQNSLFGFILALGLTLGFGLVCAHGAQAQSAPSAAGDAAADAPADMLSVAIAGFTLLPVMADDGTQARDEAGQPLFQRRPLADSVVTPGDAILYVIRVENSTAEPAENLQIGAQVAPELLFDPYSVAGPDAQALRMALEWADICQIHRGEKAQDIIPRLRGRKAHHQRQAVDDGAKKPILQIKQKGNGLHGIWPLVAQGKAPHGGVAAIGLGHLEIAPLPQAVGAHGLARHIGVVRYQNISTLKPPWQDQRIAGPKPQRGLACASQPQHALGDG